MNPVLGTPHGTGVGPMGGIATQTPTREHVAEGRVALVLVDQHEAARIDQACRSRAAPATPRKAGSIMAKANGSSCVAVHRAVRVHLLDAHHA